MHASRGGIGKLAVPIPRNLAEHIRDDRRLRPQSVSQNSHGCENGEHLQERKTLRVGRCREDVRSSIWPCERSSNVGSVPVNVLQGHG